MENWKTTEIKKVGIGFFEVAFLIMLLLGIVIVSRLVERSRAKRICPQCGLVMRTHMPTCPSCHHNFEIKNRGG